MVSLERDQTRRPFRTVLVTSLAPKKANPGLTLKRQSARTPQDAERSFGAQIEKEDNNHAMIIYFMLYNSLWQRVTPQIESHNIPPNVAQTIFSRGGMDHHRQQVA